MRAELIRLMSIAGSSPSAAVAWNRDSDGLLTPPTPDEWAAHLLAHAQALQRVLNKATGDEMPPDVAEEPREGPTRPDGPEAMREETGAVLDIEIHEPAAGIVALRFGRLSSGRIGVAMRKGSQEMLVVLECDHAKRLNRWLSGPSPAPSDDPPAPGRTLPVAAVLRMLQEERDKWDEAARKGRCGMASHSAVDSALSLIRNRVLGSKRTPHEPPAGVSEAARIRELEEKLAIETALRVQAATDAQRYVEQLQRQRGAVDEIGEALAAFRREEHRPSAAADRMIQRIARSVATLKMVTG